MEKHRCKLCYRKFTNGRALGGHMRSHMMNLQLPPRPDPPPPPPQPGCETESSTESPSLSSFCYSDSEHEDRRNSVDHLTHEDEDEEMFIQSTEPTGSSSLVTLQDRESETESFKKNPTRRRTQRKALSNFHIENEYHQHGLGPGSSYLTRDGGGNSNNRPISVSPVSSVSDVTSDEDLAYCLLMMSRDKWNTNGRENKDKNIYDSSTSRVKKKYKCETCNKVFRSYQALGGHRASHKKIRLANGNFDLNPEVQSNVELFFQKEDQQLQTQKKVHECPICHRVFTSGQALGGHKRSHVLINEGDYVNLSTNQGYSAQLSVVNNDDSPKKMKMKNMMVINGGNHVTNESLIDLNLPAPVEFGDDNEEEISQIDDVN